MLLGAKALISPPDAGVCIELQEAIDGCHVEATVVGRSFGFCFFFEGRLFLDFLWIFF